MSDLNKKIKNLLGAAVQVEFSVPFDDNSAYDYSANFSQSNFTFGLQSDYTVRTGLVVEAPANQTIKLFPSFAGKLSFFSMGLFGEIINGLQLRILPADALAISAFLPEESRPLTEIVYMPVNKGDVKKEIKKKLQSQGLSGSEIQNTLFDFIENNEENVSVKPADCIGKAEKQGLGSSPKVRIEFINSVGCSINPFYLFWLFWDLSNKKLMIFKPKSHNIIQKLGLSALNLAVNNSEIILDQPNGTSFGPYQILF